MRQIFLLLLFGITCCVSLTAQSLKGTITDTFNKKNLAYGSVALLRVKDSVLQQHTRSTLTGSFELKNIPDGQYIVMITYPSFADYSDVVNIAAGKPVNLGSIPLTLKARLLDEVVVQQTIAAMRMRGDTIEFKADSFGLRAGATVEDLLKKLPGIQVDKDGKITAMGQSVPKVLVDGEEFFGDDPTITTKGLQAKAVDKVQVFDKKSDQATFTGIDDGEVTKTINIKLKDEMKKGYFGKLDLLGGTDQRYNNSAMINAFRKKRKLSAYGIMGNTDKTGLDWQDQDKYGGGNDYEYDDAGGFYFSSGSGDAFDYNSNASQGLPKSWTGAVHYSDKFQEDKQNINASYRFNKMNNEGVSNTITQSILPGNLYYTQSNSTSFNSKNRHSVGGYYEIQIDSLTSLKITAGAYKGKTRNTTNYDYASFNESGKLTNRSDRVTTAAGDNDNLNITALLKKKFKKVGRTMTVNISNVRTTSDIDGFLLSHNSFYDTATGVITGTQNIDQLKQNNTLNNVFNGKITYTEPLAKKLFLEVNYGLRMNNNEQTRLSYNKAVDGKYSLLDPLYSNSYKYNFLIHTTGSTVLYNGKKLTASAGTDVAFADFKQVNLLNSREMKQNYTNLFPRAQVVYKFSPNTRFNFNYNGSTQQPTINQIQPVQDNNDPLNIAIGNPDLKQSFRNNFRIGYNSYKVLSETNIYISGNFSFTQNAISNRQTIDGNLRKTYQYVNVNGNYNYNSWMGYGFKFKPWDLRINFNGGLSGSRSVSFINGAQNINNTFTPNIGLGLNKWKENKYSFGMWSDINYNYTTSSLLPNQKTKYFTYNFNPYINVELPWKLSVNVEGEINLRQKVSVFDNNTNVWLLNPSISRKIFKGDKGIISIKGYDVLNQNKGFNRYISSTNVTQNTYNVITQYFALNFIWNFSKSPAGNISQAK
jgi:hypothetical protein